MIVSQAARGTFSGIALLMLHVIGLSVSEAVLPQTLRQLDYIPVEMILDRSRISTSHA